VADVKSYYEKLRHLKDAYECILKEKECSFLSNPNSLPSQIKLIVLSRKSLLERSLMEIYSMLVELETREQETKRMYHDILIISALSFAPVIIVSHLIGNFVPHISTPFNVIIQILLLVMLSFLFIILSAYLKETRTLIGKILAKRKVEKDVTLLIILSMKILRDLSHFCNRPPYHCLPIP